MFAHVFRSDWLLVGLLDSVGMTLGSQQPNGHLLDCLADNWMRDVNGLNAVAMDAAIAMLPNVSVSAWHFRYWPFERNGCRHEPSPIYHRPGVNTTNSDGPNYCRTWCSRDLCNLIHCLN